MEDGRTRRTLLALTITVYYYSCIAMSSAKVVGGSLINNLHSQTHNQPHGILNDLGWEIYPEELYNLIMRIKNHWSNMLPIFILENGVADKFDWYRAQFIVAHLQRGQSGADQILSDTCTGLPWIIMNGSKTIDLRASLDYLVDRELGVDDEQQQNLIRQKTTGAATLELIIQKTLSENLDGIITDSALSAAKEKFETFTANGFHLVPGRDDTTEDS
jgi:hypothetical protein